MLDRILLNSLLTSFSFVCPWNWGLLKKIEIITAVSENISSIINSCDFLIPDSSPQFLNPFKIAFLKPFSCVPPNGVLIVLQWLLKNPSSLGPSQFITQSILLLLNGIEPKKFSEEIKDFPEVELWRKSTIPLGNLKINFTSIL